MIENPPHGMPQCAPVLFYDDVAGAIEFLKKAFGLAERFVDRGEQGQVDHAQLAYQGAVVMLSPARSPHALRPIATPKETGKLTGCIYLFVDDVDAHAERARRAGAEIVLPPTDMHYGDRVYCALDREGHFWTFATHTRDVAGYGPSEGGQP
jgi:PhnB protein